MATAHEPKPLPPGVLSDANHRMLVERVRNAPLGQKTARKKMLKGAVNASLRADISARRTGWEQPVSPATEPPMADTPDQSEPRRPWYQDGPMA